MMLAAILLPFVSIATARVDDPKPAVVWREGDVETIRTTLTIEQPAGKVIRTTRRRVLRVYPDGGADIEETLLTHQAELGGRTIDLPIQNAIAVQTVSANGQGKKSPDLFAAIGVALARADFANREVGSKISVEEPAASIDIAIVGRENGVTRATADYRARQVGANANTPPLRMDLTVWILPNGKLYRVEGTAFNVPSAPGTPALPKLTLLMERV
ncbi:MAG: hypothetical protein SFX74_00190 [Fimbriimonadaceae bacterium]|nr:hypothetical protein [Fimbriimonadaceae bacterium]